MKFKGNKISFSVLGVLLFVSCLSSKKVDSEIQNKDNVKSTNSDTSVSLNDLYFLGGNWLDTTQNVINKSYYDTWQIKKDSIFGKSTLLKAISPGFFDTIYNESMSMIELDDRVMYVIRSSNKPLLAYPSFKKLGCVAAFVLNSEKVIPFLGLATVDFVNLLSSPFTSKVPY